MTLKRRQLVLAAAGATGVALATPLRAAETWPSKPLKIVVPYPPGGSSDIIARSISQALSEALG